MLDPLIESWQWLGGHLKDFFKWRPNFIMVHYMYMIGLTIVGSILLYPAGGMAYIDALFFAAGAATQSGLNTIDVNKLHTYQQIVLILMACVANPIFINTFVVFVRLYWFEKRFQHVISEARNRNKTRTRSRTVSEAKEDPDPARLETGVNGREIKVLHETNQPNGMTMPDVRGEVNGLSDKEGVEHLMQSVSSASQNRDVKDSGESSTTGESTPPTFLGHNPMLKREITFADEIAPQTRPSVSGSVSYSDRIPAPRSAEHHIAFLEKQRQKNQTTLRIPGPRDFDRGDMPRELDSDEDGGELDNAITRDEAPRKASIYAGRKQSATPPEKDAEEHLNDDDHPVKREIAFDEPERPHRDNNTGLSTTSSRFNPLHPLSSFRRRKDTHTPFNFNHTLSGLKNSRTFSFTKSQDRDMPEPMPYLSWQPTIGRNSAFVDLTEEQREELGGIEYRSLKTLAAILFCYYIGFHIFGVIILVPWIVRSGTWGPVIDGDGQSRVWWGIFTPMSMFTDLGFTLTPDSMVSFQTAVLPLLLGSFLIIIGNTGFPCMLRFTIWISSKFVPRGSGIWEELRFLLDHPRRCFTLLFPSKATWWLFWILFLLNAIDLIFFIILDLNDEVVMALAPGFRVLDGWFQAASTRTAGFACVNLAGLHPAIQVSYLVMMYISVFPIAISVRKTNVYEEKSLGIFAGDEEDGDEENRSYVGQHLRRQLSFDLWYIFLGLFVIAIVEGSRLQNTNEYVSLQLIASQDYRNP